MKKFFIFCPVVLALLSLTIWLYMLSTEKRTPRFYPNNSSLTSQIQNWKKINILTPDISSENREIFNVRDLSSYFTSRGKYVRIFPATDYFLPETSQSFDKAVNILILAGQEKAYMPPYGLKVLWILYPQKSNINYHDFDLIATACEKQAQELKQQGLPAVYIPQFTNPVRLKPQYIKEFEVPVLFIGNLTNEDLRPSVKYAIENHIDIAVYGQNWYKYLTPEQFKGSRIEDDNLNKYYSSAKIVLNDTLPQMHQAGIIPNRVFDVTAVNGFLISEYMPEIETVYGDTIPMYHNSEELAQLVYYYLDNPDQRQQKASQAHDITMRLFTLEKIGNLLFEEILTLVKQRIKDNTLTFE